MHPSLSEATANLYAIFCDQDFADSIVIEHGSDYLSAFNNIDNLLPRSYGEWEHDDSGDDLFGSQELARIEELARIGTQAPSASTPKVDSGRSVWPDMVDAKKLTKMEADESAAHDLARELEGPGLEQGVAQADAEQGDADEVDYNESDAELDYEKSGDKSEASEDGDANENQEEGDEHSDFFSDSVGSDMVCEGDDSAGSYHMLFEMGAQASPTTT